MTEEKKELAELQKNSADYFTVKELSVYSRIGVKTLYQEIQEKNLPHVRIGKRVIISKEDFATWFRRNTNQPVPDTSELILSKTKTRA